MESCLDWSGFGPNGGKGWWKKYLKGRVNENG